MPNMDVKQMQELARRWTAAQPTVSTFINSAVRDFHDAQDLLQRTAATLVEKAGDYNPDQPFISWAIGIAKIEVMRYRREHSRSHVMLDDQALEAVADAASRVTDDVAEMRLAMETCLQKLDGRPRRIFDLHYAQSMKPARIAESLDLTRNAVFVALHRARTALRKCMERELGMEGGLP